MADIFCGQLLCGIDCDRSSLSPTCNAHVVIGASRIFLSTLLRSCSVLETGHYRHSRTSISADLAGKCLSFLVPDFRDMPLIICALKETSLGLKLRTARCDALSSPQPQPRKPDSMLSVTRARDTPQNVLLAAIKAKYASTRKHRTPRSHFRAKRPKLLLKPSKTHIAIVQANLKQSKQAGDESTRASTLSSPHCHIPNTVAESSVSRIVAVEYLRKRQ